MMKIIGRSEKVSFPNLKIESIKSKVDTGAYNISLHVDGIEVINNALNFWIGDELNTFTFNKFKMVLVKSSFGEIQIRYSIFTRIKIGHSTYKVNVSLSDRKDMKYPVLIGRRFLRKFDYLVDVRKKNINDRSKKV